MITKYRSELDGAASQICKHSTVVKGLVSLPIGLSAHPDGELPKEKTLRAVARLPSLCFLAVERSSHGE